MNNEENKGHESRESNAALNKNTTNANKTFFIRANILKEISDYTGISVDIPKLESVLNDPSIDWLHDGTIGIILKIMENLGIPIEEQFENMSETHFSVEFTQFIAEIQDYVKNNQIEKIKIELPPAQLDSNNWFVQTENGKKFSSHACAMDYLRVFPNVITEYVSGDSTPSQFVADHWFKDADGIIRSALEKPGVLAPGQIRAAIESIANITRIVDPHQVNLPLDQIMPLPAHVIPIKEGLFNLIDKTIIPHTPDFFYTESLPRKYVADARPDIFMKFLDSVFTGDPDAELKKSQIFETIAWALTMDYSIQGAVIFYGQGGEGKSIIHEVIADLLVWTSSITLKELEADKFKRAELYGSWANMISESTTEIITSEWFKRVTDGTQITVDRKNGHPFKMVSHAKLIIDTNELPTKENELRAFYRRIIAIIDFPNKLEDILTPDQIRDFVEKLKSPDELDAIFSFVVDNFYGPLVQTMKFTKQLDAKDAEKKWEERSNPASAFIKMKEEEGLILTDVEDVRRLLEGDEKKLKLCISRDKEGLDEYLTTIKQDIITEAIKWATEKGFPAKNINAGSLGRALVSLGYPNLTVNKKLSKGSIVKAWREILIMGGNGSVTDPKNDPLPLESQSEMAVKQISNGTVLHSNDLKVNSSNKIAGREASVTKSVSALENTEENVVTGQNRQNVTDPLPDDKKLSEEPAKSTNSDAKTPKYFSYEVLQHYIANGLAHNPGEHLNLPEYLKGLIDQGFVKCLNCDEKTETKPMTYRTYYYKVTDNIDRYSNESFFAGSDIRFLDFKSMGNFGLIKLEIPDKLKDTPKGWLGFLKDSVEIKENEYNSPAGGDSQ